jgi:hypothetical protein
VGYCSRNQELKVPSEIELETPERQGKFFQGAENSDLFSKVFKLHKSSGVTTQSKVS